MRPSGNGSGALTPAVLSARNPSASAATLSGDVSWVKILTLRFRNINSLKGEWKIDFTREPFSGNALFAITGPTGAGKTTILDAICLALYHKTPRLDVSQSENQLMTRRAHRAAGRP